VAKNEPWSPKVNEKNKVPGSQQVEVSRRTSLSPFKSKAPKTLDQIQKKIDENQKEFQLVPKS
jgi:hypothetical protein